MANNNDSLLDSDEESSDWIELWNPTDSDISLANHFLTDNAARPNKWALPEIILGPNQFLVIFASGKDRTDPEKELHTDFQLSSSEGSYLALTRKSLVSGLTSVEEWLTISGSISKSGPACPQFTCGGTVLLDCFKTSEGKIYE